MPKFGSTSKERLSTCDSRLQLLMNEVVKTIDCSVLCGYRGEEDQNKAVAEGRSKATYPSGRHNANPSRAVDIAPYDKDVKGYIPWDDRERLTLFAGFVMGTAERMGIKIRWGGDWDKDWKVQDNTFDDFPHFELLE